MGSLVVIGNFDGVHRGHRALFDRAVLLANEERQVAKLLTFDPHPAEVLGRAAPPVLTRRERKRELVERHAPSLEVVVQRFDAEFAAQSPHDFAEWLRAEFDTKTIVVGKNFRFGRGRAGSFDDLARLGSELGFTACAESLVGDESGAWSSTRIRGAIGAGDVGGAAAILGRPHMLQGEVVHGKKLGRTLGFPTANLAHVIEIVPPIGIYAVLVDRAVDAPDHSPKTQFRALAKGALSIGKNPTTDTDGAIKLEVNLFDIEEDLYGTTLRVHVVGRVRDEQRFDSLEALKNQISKDCDRAREILADAVPSERWGSFG